MDDGAALAATLYLPDGTAPAGGWPAVILMHGLAGDRASMNTLAQAMGLVGEDYAVLTFDARGHGLSGGLIGIDGPREISDVRAVFTWLAARPDVADGKIGAWGISYGGGAALNSLAAGVPWAAVEVAETWSDALSALVPQGLAKSGVIGGFLTALPQAKVDPAVFAVRDAAFAGRIDEVRPFAAERSSLARRLAEQDARVPHAGPARLRVRPRPGDSAVRRAGGAEAAVDRQPRPPALDLPAVDSAAMLAEGRQWFDRYLRDVSNGIERKPPVVLAREGRAEPVSYAGLPPTRPQTSRAGQAVSFKKAPARTIAQSGRWLQRGSPARGRGGVRQPDRARDRDRRRRLVAPRRDALRQTPAGREIAVSAAACPPGPGTHTYQVALLHQATYVPAGSTWKVTVASSTLAQSPGNLMYLDLPMPAAGSGLTVTGALFAWPTPARRSLGDARSPRPRSRPRVAAAALAGPTADPGVSATSVASEAPCRSRARPPPSAPSGRARRRTSTTSTRRAACNGRKIEYASTTTPTTRAQTVQLTRKLVEQDQVFAIFNSVGTANNLAIREYLNAAGCRSSSSVTARRRSAARRALPVDDGLPPELPRRGRRLRQDLASTAPRRESPCSSRTRRSART